MPLAQVGLPLRLDLDDGPEDIRGPIEALPLLLAGRTAIDDRLRR